MANLTFFHNPMSRAGIVRWALEEVGADYTIVPVAWDDKPDALWPPTRWARSQRSCTTRPKATRW